MGKRIRILVEPASHAEDWWNENETALSGSAKKLIAIAAYEAGEKNTIGIGMLIGGLLFVVGLVFGAVYG